MDINDCENSWRHVKVVGRSVAAAAAADDRRGGCVVLMTASLECQRWDEKSSERDRAPFNDN